ncbi:MAG TPA: hypothetical protein VFC96_05710, partial [Anaerovoracaceae bacterium]|nr:hypothetical protein [Anaerovoracaceae bacterium]
VDTRASYRFIDYRDFDKAMALMFALIPNADEISCIVYDDYSDINVPDTSFASAYCDKTLLYQRADDMGYFTIENIENATSDLDIFTSYYKKVSALQPYSDSGYNSLTTAIYNVIGEDCEIVVNSGLLEYITITKKLANKPEVNAILAQRNINICDYIDKQLEIQTYMIRNFKTNEYSDYLFVFNDDELITSEKLGVSGTDKEFMDVIRPYTDK